MIHDSTQIDGATIDAYLGERFEGLQRLFLCLSSFSSIARTWCQFNRIHFRNAITNVQ